MGIEGERLRAARKGRYTQEQLADLSGIRREKIARIESGTRRMSATDAAYLARALEMRADDLVRLPEPQVRYRLGADAAQAEVDQVVEWFEDFVQDTFYLERAMKRHGLE